MTTMDPVDADLESMIPDSDVLTDNNMTSTSFGDTQNIVIHDAIDDLLRASHTVEEQTVQTSKKALCVNCKTSIFVKNLGGTTKISTVLGSRYLFSCVRCEVSWTQVPQRLCQTEEDRQVKMCPEFRRPGAKNTIRGTFNCRKCGMKKRDHICQAPDAVITKAPRQTKRKKKQTFNISDESSEDENENVSLSDLPPLRPELRSADSLSRTGQPTSLDPSLLVSDNLPLPVDSPPPPPPVDSPPPPVSSPPPPKPLPVIPSSVRPGSFRALYGGKMPSYRSTVTNPPPLPVNSPPPVNPHPVNPAAIPSSVRPESFRALYGGKIPSNHSTIKQTKQAEYIGSYPRPIGRTPHDANGMLKAWDAETGIWKTRFTSLTSGSKSTIAQSRPRGRTPRDANGNKKVWNEKKKRWQNCFVVTISVPLIVRISVPDTTEGEWSVGELSDDEDM